MIDPLETISGVALRDCQGTVYALGPPYRHHDCIAWLKKLLCETALLGLEQGFITTCGRFVDRCTALEIALASGQISIWDRPVPELPELFSEDLW